MFCLTSNNEVSIIDTIVLLGDEYVVLGNGQLDKKSNYISLDSTEYHLYNAYNDGFTVFNEEIINILKHKSIIAGGAIRSLLLNEKVNDYDIFLFDKSDIDFIVNFCKEKNEIFKFTENAINFLINDKKYQIITSYSGTPAWILSDFDFTNSMCYYKYGDSNIKIDSLCKEHILNKQLGYNHSKSPLKSILRLNKFLKQGWTIDNENLINLIAHINGKNYKNEDFENLKRFVGYENETLSQRD